MKSLRCPTCQQTFDPERTPAMPFCSDRCRLVDLKRWLAEEQGVPLDECDEEEVPRERPRPGNGEQEQ